jgi:hypothetical protein
VFRRGFVNNLVDKNIFQVETFNQSKNLREVSLMKKLSRQNSKKPLSVVVIGDVTLDCYVARNRTAIGEDEWNQSNYAQAFLQPGGALLLGEVVEAVAGQLDEQEKIAFEIRKIKDVSMDLCHKGFHRSFALWSLFDYKANSSSQPKVWRVEEFLGLQRSNTGQTESLLEKDLGPADIVIFDDANLGFRGTENLWNKSIINEKTWILLKMELSIRKSR